MVCLACSHNLSRKILRQPSCFDETANSDRASLQHVTAWHACTCSPRSPAPSTCVKRFKLLLDQTFLLGTKRTSLVGVLRLDLDLKLVSLLNPSLIPYLE